MRNVTTTPVAVRVMVSSKITGGVPDGEFPLTGVGLASGVRGVASVPLLNGPLPELMRS